jgi:hypothetical protein
MEHLESGVRVAVSSQATGSDPTRALVGSYPRRQPRSGMTVERADRYRALFAACLGGLFVSAVLLAVYWYQVGAVNCDVSTPQPSYDIWVDAAIVVGLADLGVCVASWYPLREHDSSSWAVINGLAAVLLVLLSVAVKHGFLRGGGC